MYIFIFRIKCLYISSIQ